MSTVSDIQGELRELLSRERELIRRADHAVVTREYRTLRDLAEELMSLAARQSELRLALVEARAQDEAHRRESNSPPRPDDPAATGRRLH